MGDLARRQAAKLDALGVGVGERVAVVSHNSARLLTSFFGVAGSGRVLVPVNFRLRPDEVRYIVGHSGARVLCVDPELDEALAGRDGRAPVRARRRRAPLRRGPRGGRLRTRPWEPDENATACINYTSGTTARPKGVQITHRNIWTNAVTFALHAAVTDRDVYLHTLPMFHANGWGMPFAMTGLGVKQVVLRKIDGAEILRRVRGARRDHHVRRPGGGLGGARGRADLGGRDPRARQGADHHGRRTAPTKTVVRVEEELGWEFIQIYGLTETSPLLTINRTRAEWDDLSARGRGPRSSCGPGRRRSGSRLMTDELDPRSRRGGAGPLQRGPRGLLGAARGERDGAARRVVPHR